MKTMTEPNVDGRDRKILELLQSDARTPNAEIARSIDLAPSAVHERVKGLRERGVVRGYHASIDRAAVGFGVAAFVEVRTGQPLHDVETGEALAAIDEVLEVHDIAGDACFLVKAVARDLEHLHAVVNAKVGSVPGVSSTKTTIVMKTIKETVAVPIGG